MGKHLILDLECKNKQLMNDIPFMENLLSKLTKIVMMEPLTKPKIVQGADYNPGITGFIIIETSHIAIHTFIDRDRISFDLYSCRNYDENNVMMFLKKNIVFKILNIHIIARED